MNTLLLLLLHLRRACGALAPLLVAAVGAAHAEGLPQSSQDTVHWHVNNFPPYSITSGPEAGQGINDLAMAQLIKGMPEFQHKIVDASLARVLENIKTRNDACSVSLLKTPEREAWMYFSSQRGLVLPNALVMLRNRAEAVKPFLNAQGEVVLASLLADGHFKLGLSAERSYGQPVDQVIKRHPEAIVTISAKDQFVSRLLKLVNQNEFDAVLGYAIELKYTAREMKLNMQDFAIYPLAESSGLLPVSVACSKSEMGRRVIVAINHLLADKNLRREMDAQYRSWLDDESALYYDQLLRQLRSASSGPKGTAP